MTDKARWARIEALFDAALQLPPEAREAWLRGASEGDDAIADEVLAMLRAHDTGGGILDAPAMAAPSDNLPTRLTRALGERYAILHEIGRGGGGTVFLAEERKHGRRVVLKVLNPGMALACGPERFNREVRIAARLAHPHIVGLIDSGEADGLLFYVMPWVEGETLRTRLAQEGTLPLDEAVGLLRDIADALRFAHGRGVVHRDLKPENVLCSGRHAYLLDFGVAKLLEHAPGESTELTAQGNPVGTLAYMAPEQLRGGPGVDHRADVYAWGLIAWEMLSGALPPYDPAYLDDQTAVVSGLRLDAPPGLERLILAALEPDPRARLASAELIIEGLDRLSLPVATAVEPQVRPRRTRKPWALAGLGVAAAAAALLLWPRDGEAPVPAVRARVPEPVAVAVLINETGDPTLDIWGRMAGDWITQGLQETGLVQVVPWPTARRAAELALAAGPQGGDPVAGLRDETGAGSVITGSYYRVGDSVHFRAELVDAVTGRLLEALPALATSVGSPELGVRALRDRLMGVVAVRLDERLAQQPGVTLRPPRYDAYEAFDRGLSKFQSQDYAGALPDFRASHALDTTFSTALFYAGLAAWNVGDFHLLDSLVAQLEGRRGTLNAYERARLEGIRAAIEGDPEAQRRALRRSAEGTPDSPSWYNLALVELATDHPAEALAALDQLNPDRGSMRGWSSYWTQRSHALHLLNRHAEELAAVRELQRRFPDRRVGTVLEVRALAATGNTAAIDSVVLSAQALPPTTYWSVAGALVTAGEDLRAHGHADAGERYLNRAVGWLEAQLSVNPDYEAHHYWLASAWYALGKWDDAAREYRWLLQRHPDRLAYRGMAMLTDARLGRASGQRELTDVPARLEGDRLAYEARLAAVRGQPDRAASRFREAMQHGVDGLAWLHATAWPELLLVATDRARLPASLRVGPAAPSATPVLP